MVQPILTSTCCKTVPNFISTLRFEIGTIVFFSWFIFPSHLWYFHPSFQDGMVVLVLMNKNFVSKSGDHANYSASAWPPNSLIIIKAYTFSSADVELCQLFSFDVALHMLSL